MSKIHAKQMLGPDGWVEEQTIDIGKDGRIAHVGTANGGDRIDLVLPAPVNLHSHTFQRAMSGLTEARGPDPSDSFWTWRALMYRFLEQLTPEDIEAIAAQAFMEMVETGFAAVAEFHYLHHGPDGQTYDQIDELSQRICVAAQAAGIGLTHLPVLYQYGGCDGRALEGGQLRFGNTTGSYYKIYDAARVMVSNGPADWNIGTAPHSLRAVNFDGLRAAEEIADKGPMHLHVAEQIAEVEEIKAHLGARTVEWLLAEQDVDTRWCLIHCTQMTQKETVDLAKSGAVAGLCPITESSLGDGIFNGVEYAAANGCFGVGSDSNIHISLWEELKTFEYSQRLRDKSRAAMAEPQRSTGRVLYEKALAGGAQAAQRHSGAIAVGQWADLIGISTDNEWICGREGDLVLDSLIFSGRGESAVTDVWSAGRHVVREGRHIARDRIQPEFMRSMRRLEQVL
ncbi:MAG: formimidoylglutamate deiminase [Pseudomonadota bacterium]